MARPLHRLFLMFAVVMWPIVALAAPPPKPANDDKRVPGWGTIVDPDSDCTVKGDKDKLTITVPATHHTLNPERAMNAPRVLQEIAGNFTATVKVTCELDPGKNSTRNKGGTAGNYAGILLWGSDKNFVRLERNARWQTPTGPFVCFAPCFEYWLDGAMKVSSPQAGTPAFFKGKSTWFSYERKGVELVAKMSHDGKEWEHVSTIPITVPKAAQIGVLAVNSSDKPFTVEFTDFSITKAK
jgi:hypothetical protein